MHRHDGRNDAEQKGKDMLEGKELAQAILSEASAALQEFDVVASDEEDEDDI